MSGDASVMFEQPATEAAKKKAKATPAQRKRRNYMAELAIAEAKIERAIFCLEQAGKAKTEEAKADFWHAALEALNGE